MRKFLQTILLVLVILLTRCFAQAKSTDKPIWSQQAIPLDLSCATIPSRIPSPDHRSLVEITCTRKAEEDAAYMLRITTRKGVAYDTPLRDGAHEMVWSPDSKAFFIDGGATAYSGFFVTVYVIDPSGSIQKRILTQVAQRDMVESFPPCKAFNRDPIACTRIAANPEYNMSGIAWVHNSSAIDVFAEIPCSSSYGGIMCQVLGYELSVPDGRILKRLTARQVQSRWQKQMAWKMHIPDAPVYGPAQNIR